jgi:hypothetical protein
MDDGWSLVVRLVRDCFVAALLTTTIRTSRWRIAHVIVDRNGWKSDPSKALPEGDREGRPYYPLA